MEKPTIKKTIELKASAVRVWEVLFDPQYRDIWSSEFSPDSHIEGVYAEGNEITFVDGSQQGLKGKVTDMKSHEFLHLDYIADIVNGVEHEFAKGDEWAGTSDTYKLHEENGVTTLTVMTQVPSDEEVLEFEPLWDNALAKIKSIAEK